MAGSDIPAVHLYSVLYLGSSMLDRRYMPYTQSIMPWLIAEIRRKRDEFREVTLELTGDVLRARYCDCKGTEILFEHPLHALSRFAKTHQDPKCFAYISRASLKSGFECHVFLAPEEHIVPQLFSSIREASRDCAFSTALDEMGESKDESKAFYEVLYVGQAQVTARKITSVDLDNIAERLIKEEFDKHHNVNQYNNEDSVQRHRHASDASTKSLPATLEETIKIAENELSHQRVSLNRTDHNHVDSEDSSVDELSSYASSTENVLDGSGGSSDFKDKDLVLGEKDITTVRNVCCNEKAIVSCDCNRTMVFRLGQHDISMISLDKRTVFLETDFKDISFVSQGHSKKDIFGFITRDHGGKYLCHILKCHSSTVVDEIMLALRVAFHSAYEQNKQSHQICTQCPIHQFHKLCQEIHGLSSSIAYELVLNRFQRLPDTDTHNIYTKIKHENPQSYDEMLELLMIGIRQLCETKQLEHTHISNNSKNSKSEFSLLDKQLSKFDNFKNKAKKSLTSSFETLLKATKKEDARDGFRQRSYTVDSDSTTCSWSRSMDSSLASTPDASPLQSPVAKEFGAMMTSPVSSPPPFRRQRSSTLGALPDTSTFQQKRLEAFSPKEKQSRRVSMNSPMKQMFLMAGTQCVSSMDSTLTENTLSPSVRRHSWRQEIFNRVVTPVSLKKSLSDQFEERDGPRKRTSQEIRMLWKKAYLQTLLLLRMDKENQSLQARQDEMEIQRQRLHYDEITPCLREVSKSWDEMLEKSEEDRVVQADKEKLLQCVKQGVPQYKRGDIWLFLVEQHRMRILSKSRPPDLKHYRDLLKQLTTHQHSILIDLSRTFPGHPYFATQLGPGQLSLFNALKAYSLLDHDVGYCQGLSFIAGILLMHMDELDAFRTLHYMMYDLGLRNQFRPNMINLQIKLYQLTRLIHDKYKDLYEHLEENEIAPTLYAAPWFLTLYASQYPLGFVARVFDLLFIQGPDVLFKVAIVLLGNHKELIMQCDCFESIVEFLKTTLPEMSMIQMERIINQAFEMDISKQLQAYEVEYHVLREEMLYSPQRGDVDLMQKLEQANYNLKEQNMELLEKLQQANSHHHSLDIAINNYQANENKMKSRIQTLEIERNALLNTIAKLRQIIPREQIDQLDLPLPLLSPTLPSSPLIGLKNMTASRDKEGENKKNNNLSPKRQSPSHKAVNLNNRFE